MSTIFAALTLTDFVQILVLHELYALVGEYQNDGVFVRVFATSV